MVLRILPALVLATLVPVVPAQGAGAAPADKQPTPHQQKQEPAVQEPPAQDPPAQEAAAQDPAPRGPSEADRLGQLQRELQRLQSEIEFVRDRLARSTELLRGTFTDRRLDVRVIDAGRAPVVASQRALSSQPQKARVMSEDEIAQLGEGVLMLVDGSRVTEEENALLMDYLATLPGAGEEPVRAQRAVYELIRVHALLGTFAEGSELAATRAQNAARELADGQAWEEVQQRYGSYGLKEGGQVQITRSCPFGLFVERAAFATEPGHVSAPVRALTGMALIAVDAVQKGETPQGDVVEARMILIPYSDRVEDLEKARARAATGQVDIAVRSPDLLPMLPGMLRAAPVQAQPQPHTDGDKLKPVTLDPDKEQDAPAEPIPPKKDPPKKNPDRDER